jgi:hypothetical protein
VTATKKTARGSEGGGLRLRDVLRMDVPAIYRALSESPPSEDGGRENSLVRRTYRFVHWLEHGGKRRVRPYLVTPLPLAWAWAPGDGSWSTQIHKRYLREMWKERGLVGRILLAASLLLWLPVLLVLVAWASVLNGMATRRRVHKSITQQVLEQFYFAGRYGILPVWYYMFELFEPAQRRKAPHYIHRYELKSGLLQVLRASVPKARRTPTRNKTAFMRQCAQAGIPTIDTIALFRDGKLKGGRARQHGLPPRDLFVKPVHGRGGEGAGLWRWTGDGYRLNEGATLNAEALTAQLSDWSQTRPLLVQPHAQNHPALADLSNGALCTARIVTLRNEYGGHEAVCALFRMAVGGNQLVDNFHAGGIAAPVDVISGRLGAATDWGLRPRHGWRTHHPDTGGMIEGRFLPLWAETRGLAERAHAAFADRHIIGWDMAILEDGPHIVEANGGPDTDMHQRVSRNPLGNQRFGELMALHLKKA